MPHRYYIEDELHAEPHSEHGSFAEAVVELQQVAKIPWDKIPNKAPCQGWRTCGRKYEVVEYDPAMPDEEVSRVSVLEISAEGIVWNKAIGLP